MHVNMIQLLAFIYVFVIYLSNILQGKLMYKNLMKICCAKFIHTRLIIHYSIYVATLTSRCSENIEYAIPGVDDVHDRGVLDYVLNLYGNCLTNFLPC